jgi:hypothetical protein
MGNLQKLNIYKMSNLNREDIERLIEQSHSLIDLMVNNDLLSDKIDKKLLVNKRINSVFLEKSKEKT